MSHNNLPPPDNSSYQRGLPLITKQPSVYNLSAAAATANSPSNPNLHNFHYSNNSNNNNTKQHLTLIDPTTLPSTSSSSLTRSSSSSLSSPIIDPNNPAIEAPVVVEFRRWLRENPTIAVAVAAMQALISVVRQTKATTLMGLEIELKAAVDQLKSCQPNSISLAAGCELFSRYVTRTSLDIPNFNSCIQHLLQRGQSFAKLTSNSRQQISELVDRFISDGSVILIHGYSRVVQSVLLSAAVNGKHFSVIITECRPNCDGYTASASLIAAGIPVSFILDSAISYSMQRVDLVLMGAEAVVESGGIINRTGTFNIAIIAKAFKKPFYVAAECYKFARLFPLNQTDLTENKADECILHAASGNTNRTVYEAIIEEAYKFNDNNKHNNNIATTIITGSKVSTSNFNPELAASTLLSIENPSCDYTPPEYITLLFTDLGILTPSAVSDELIKLYY